MHRNPEGQSTQSLTRFMKYMAPSLVAILENIFLSTPNDSNSHVLLCLNGVLIVNQIRVVCSPWGARKSCKFSPALIPIPTKPRKATVHYKGTGSAARLSPSSDVLNHPVVEVQRIRQRKGWTNLRGCTHGPNGASTQKDTVGRVPRIAQRNTVRFAIDASGRRNLAIRKFEIVVLGDTNRRPDGGFDEIKN